MCSLNQRTYCSAQKMLFVEQDVAEIKALLIEITKNNGGEITTILTEDISAIPPAPEQEANM